MNKRAYTLCLLIMMVQVLAVIETYGQSYTEKSSRAAPQGIKLSGKIIDSDGAPVIGAGIV